MRRPAGGALATAGAAAVVVLVPAHAAGPLHRPRTDPAAAALLEQAARAPEQVSYRGTQFVMLWSDGGATAAQVEVLHRAGQGSLLRLAPTAQGPGESVFRPATGNAGVPDVAGVGRGTFSLLARNYEAYVERQEPVAGRVADVVAVRRGGASPTARFWLDRQTRLVLRREVYDADGRTLHASAFVSFDLTAPTLPPHQAAEQVPAPAGVPIGRAERDRMRADGWWLDESLPDGLELYEARIVGSGDDTVLHLSYSDGVSTISLFEQLGRLNPDELDGWRSVEVGGAKVYEKPTFPRRMVWGGEGRVFTLVAECRQTTLAGIVAAVPHGGNGRGLLDRLGHGLSRVGSWFNPFG